MRTLSLGVAAALVLVASAASAHPKLLSASPAPGGSIAGSPREIRLSFSEAVYPRLSAVTLSNRAGAVVKTGRVNTAAGNSRQVVAPINAPLAPGRYHVAWRAVSTDTHHVQGQFDFTVK
ncbi:MAG TPA: copper homeostasis periplasmic binding protein CopC [Caulobacteraceae bacterium]